MSEHIINLEAELANPDFALVVDYAEENLDSARMDEVRLRMETDEEFRRFAAPIVAVWTAQPQVQVPVRPREELVKAWDDFTLRAGFVHQRKRLYRRRGLWLLALLITAGAMTTIVTSVTRARAERAAAAERALYKEVGVGGQAITLAPGTAVEVAEGARVRVAQPDAPGSVDTVRVLGSATLRIVPNTLGHLVRTAAARLTVKTLATVEHSDSLVVIRALSDTTPVAIYVEAPVVAPPDYKAPVQDSVRVKSLKPIPTVVVVPGRPYSVDDSAAVQGDPVPGQPKKKGKHYWAKGVLYLVAMVAVEVLVR
jgi:hypothetical protein